ncbi:MAG: collagen triple helix repeat domain protein [Gammaproteobacteria bacterium]|nr:collagen triple helix repeat domain protein [Gammaproteobacteria bacterium]
MKKLNLLFLLGSCFLASTANAAAILDIVPSIRTTTLGSNSETEVLFTVTNNTNQPINNLSINPSYQTTGRSSSLSLQNNHCTTTLAANGQCTFQVLIQGAGQPASFQVSPQVCGYDGQICSMPISANRVQVAVNAVSTPFAYYSVFSGNNANKLVPVNTNTLTLGTPANASFSDPYQWEGVAVSRDGSRVYVVQDGTNPQSLGIFSSGLKPQLIDTVPLTDYVYNLNQVAVTPNGNQIYVSTFGSGLYAIAHQGNNYSVSKLLTGFVESEGVETSPDGAYAYVTDYGNGSFSVINTSTNTVIKTLSDSVGNCQFYAPATIAVSPDNHTIYVGNQGDYLTVIQNSNGQFSCAASTINFGGQVFGMAVSPNGQYLYVIVAGNSINVINTQTRSVVDTYALSNLSALGVAISPDGHKLFISNLSGSAYMVPLVNGLPVGQATEIDVGGYQGAIGHFVG